MAYWDVALHAAILLQQPDLSTYSIVGKGSWASDKAE